MDDQSRKTMSAAFVICKCGTFLSDVIYSQFLTLKLFASLHAEKYIFEPIFLNALTVTLHAFPFGRSLMT